MLLNRSPTSLIHLQEENGGSSGLARHFRNFDRFGMGFRMKLDKASRVQRSIMGSCLTFVLGFIIISFAYTKFITLIEYNDIDIFSFLTEDAIDQT